MPAGAAPAAGAFVAGAGLGAAAVEVPVPAVFVANGSGRTIFVAAVGRAGTEVRAG